MENNNNIEKDAIYIYNKNLEFLKETDEATYKKLNLFEIALTEGLINPNYELEYKENKYFDIFNNKEGTFFYETNSNEYNKEILNKINFDLNKDSFKTFYNLKYTNDVIEQTKQSSVRSSMEFIIAPIVHYYNSNLPESAITKEMYKFIIFGVGIGSHIPKIHKKLGSKLYLIVEPNIEIFRLSLFVTKYYELAKETKLLFSVSDNENEFINIFAKFYNEAFILNHYLKFFMLTNNFNFYTRIIQNYLVSQSHMIYSFNRYFIDIERTIYYIRKNYPILNISKNQQLDFMKKPVIILGAGPSLQKNIELLKKNKDRFIIVALYATISFLEKNDIKPDIITQLEDQDEGVMFTIKNVKDTTFFKDSICLFSSKVIEKLMYYFTLENIYLFQCLFQYKKDFGIMTSPSIGEVTYALSLLLGARNIYFLGIDMALGEDDKSHIEGHIGSEAFKNIDNESTDLNYNFRKNIIEVNGNLKEFVRTTPVFKTSINTIDEITRRYKKDCKVYNFSQNGAFFQGTIPLNINEFNFKELLILDKINLNMEIKKGLNLISEKGFNEKDYVDLKKKIENAKEMKNKIEQFIQMKKYSNENQFRNELVNLIQELLGNKYKACEDLQKTIYNYLCHTVHYVLNFLYLKNVSNHKRHIKQLNKYFSEKLKMIVDEYIRIIDKKV